MINTLNYIIFAFVLILLFVLTIFFIYSDEIKTIIYRLFRKNRIKKNIKKFAIDQDFPLLNDIKIQTGKKKFIKIDYVLIGDKYIYVIESKTYVGFLSAKAKDKKWMLYKNDKLIHIENPLLNNSIRLKYLANLLQTNEEDFINVIYLAKPAEIVEIENNKANEIVVEEKNFNKIISYYETKSTLTNFSNKAIHEASKKIFEFHKKSEMNFKILNQNH